jgi:hypothetical protein
MFNVMTGYHFKQNYSAISNNLYKLTHETENHNGLQLRDGLNIDPVPFNAGEFTRGGIYCCVEEEIPNWIEYRDKRMNFYRKVIVPDDAKVKVFSDKVKVSKLILLPRIHIWSDYDLCLKIVKEMGTYLEFVNPLIMDYQMSLTAVKNDGWALKFVKTHLQTVEICRIAMKESHGTIDFMREDLRKLFKHRMK